MHLTVVFQTDCKKKTSIIIEILEECSSGLSAAKHSQLIEIMKLKICNPNDLKIQKKYN